MYDGQLSASAGVDRDMDIMACFTLPVEHLSVGDIFMSQGKGTFSLLFIAKPNTETGGLF